MKLDASSLELRFSLPVVACRLALLYHSATSDTSSSMYIYRLVLLLARIAPAFTQRIMDSIGVDALKRGARRKPA